MVSRVTDTNTPQPTMSMMSLLYLFLAALACWSPLVTAKGHVTPKYAADSSERVLNIHMIAHTHDDVGWLKTVEQYYNGLNNTIQPAAVKYVLSSSMNALTANSNRTFTYVEQKFFSMWWNDQTDVSKGIVKDLVKDGQLTFVNGGWCMHDEASTHFMGMIDQTTLGHDLLKHELGVIPTVGWQLDPFGHSATQASFMAAEMGFNALYFGRVDYQDLELRKDTRECEGLWSSSPNLEDATVFWGLTGSYKGNYNPPDGFCFDVQCDDEKLVGQPRERLIERVAEFVSKIKVQSDQTQGNHVMLTMGTDFRYSNALVNFDNLDLLIHSMLEFQQAGDVDIASLLGPDFDRLSVFYSSPEYYTEQKYLEAKNSRSINSASYMRSSAASSEGKKVVWSTKSDDFFPYANEAHAYWTGYFTSRTGFKRMERVGSSFLLAARQIESMHPSSEVDLCCCCNPLYALEDALGVSQHHDSISGTAKQHVANDYSKRLQAGINEAAEFSATRLRHLLLGDTADDWLQDLSFCQLLNETTCAVSENVKADEDDLYVVLYNNLAQWRSTVVGVPLPPAKVYTVHRLVGGADGLKKLSVKHWRSESPSEGKTMLYLESGPLPPVGSAVFRIAFGSEQEAIEEQRRTNGDSCQDTDGEFTNGVLDIQFDCDTGMIRRVSNELEGFSLAVAQEWGYYTSFDASRDNSTDGLMQNSGAYIFRPGTPKQQITKVFPASGRAVVQKTSLGIESSVVFEEPWIEQVTRVYNDQPYIEVEYTVGPIPVDDGIGKEIVTRYSTPIQSQATFYTDSNGREFQKRIRSYRPTWTLDENEPVAGNFYPVNAASYIEDSSSSLAVAVDRSQAGASLEDGSIELMVQRRLLVDDVRGVGEPLNETFGGVTPYPPYGDATRYGAGIVFKGKHRLMVGGGMSGASLARSKMDDAFSDPLVFVGSAPKGSPVPFERTSFSGLTNELPANVMLITLKRLRREPAITFLVRLGHQYAAGEDEELSKPVSIDIGSLLLGYDVVSLTEKTLSGNQDRSEWMEKRMKWTDQMQKTDRRAQSPTDFNVELRPMEIRTFAVRVQQASTKVNA